MNVAQYGDLAFEKEAIFVTYAGLQKLVSTKSAQGNVGIFGIFFPPANTEERDAFSGRFSAVGYPRDDAGIRPRANSLPVDKRPGIFALDSKYRQYSPRMSQK